MVKQSGKHQKRQIELPVDRSFWDFRLPVDQLNDAITRYSFQLRKQDRQILADRLDVSGFTSITGEIKISELATRCWQVDFSIFFDVVQPCIVSFDDVSEKVEFVEQERYIDTLDTAEEMSGEQLDLEALDNGHIPLGEAVAQLVSVHLPAFPRSTTADKIMDENARTGDISPFHKLSELKKPQ
ncbi:MAG: hypothetical protein ACPH4L_04085 [Candidatus Puniceispirillaceae bacterium]